MRNIKQFILSFLVLFFLNGCAHTPPTVRAEKPFRFETDTPSFANETVWNYEKNGKDNATRQGQYNRRCFTLCRASVQFWKFARFEPGTPLTEPELTKRIRAVTEKDVWESPLPLNARIIFPGFANFRQITAAHPDAFKKNLGLGWPSYFRAGNFALVFPRSKEHQERTNRELLTNLAWNYPSILWLTTFPKGQINHIVVVYGVNKENGKFDYLVYDPNYSDRPGHLTYSPAQKAFFFEKTFYFPGGKVSVRPIYLSPVE